MSPEDWNRWVAAAIESAVGWWPLFDKGGEMRDKFPLPTYVECRQWLAFWKDDRQVWEKCLGEILPRGWNRPKGRETPRNRIARYLDAIVAFFSNPDAGFWDRYFGSVRVRFLIRVFLPCVVLHRSRPSALLAQCIEHKDIAILESLLRIDPTLVYLPSLAPILNPPQAATRAEVWQLLGPSLASDAPLLERRQASYHLIAFVQWIGRAVHRRAKITALADALQEGDLPDTPGTTQKAIWRLLGDAPLPG